MTAQHLVGDPEWVIESSGGGSFQVDCHCGWLESGFDTASLARAAGFEHSTGRRAATFTPTAGEKRRWWQRGK